MNLKQVIWVLSGLITLAQCQSEEEVCDPKTPKKVTETVQSHLTNTVKNVVQEFFSGQLAEKDERIATVEVELGELTKLTKVNQIKAHFCEVSGFFKLFSYIFLDIFEHLNLKNSKRNDQNWSIRTMILFLRSPRASL